MKMSPVVAAAVVSADPANGRLSQILRAVRMHLGMDVGFISEFHNGCRVFRHVESAAGKNCIAVNDADPLEDSYCHRVAEGRLPRLIKNAKDHPLAAGPPITARLPIGAYMSVPITLRDGSVYGAFCCFSVEPGRSLNERDMANMEAFAAVAAEQIQQDIDEGQVRNTKASRINDVLRSRNVAMVYQPAIRIDAPRIEFVEALARFYTRPYHSPDRWFANAGEVGLRQELELLALRHALEGLDSLPDRTSLSINASPEVIISPEFEKALRDAPLRRVIIEITEHQAVTRYPALIRALAPLREAGLRIAIDDMGAGFSSLRHILHLKPELIKLDMTLSQGIDKDPGRRALASALLSFSRETGSELVAEGVETEGELQTLRGLGVNIVQGFLFGQPAPELPDTDLLQLLSRI